MVEMLKNMRAYLIYNGFIFLFLLVGYVLIHGNFVGEDCDWIWMWLVPSVYVLAFELYLAGAVFALVYQKHEFTTKEVFLSALVILVTTFLSVGIPTILESNGQELLESLCSALLFPVCFAGTYCVVYFIARFIYQRTWWV